MNPLQRLAQLALIYIGRAELKGNEVQTFCEVHNWLTSVAENATIPQPQQLEAPNEAHGQEAGDGAVPRLDA